MTPCGVSELAPPEARTASYKLRWQLAAQRRHCFVSTTPSSCSNHKPATAISALCARIAQHCKGSDCTGICFKTKTTIVSAPRCCPQGSQFHSSSARDSFRRCLDASASINCPPGCDSSLGNSFALHAVEAVGTRDHSRNRL